MNQPPTLPPDHASSSLDAGSSFNTGDSSEGATGEKRWELRLGVIRSQLDPQIYAAYL